MLNSRAVPAQGNIIGLAALGLQRGEPAELRAIQCYSYIPYKVVPHS